MYIGSDKQKQNANRARDIANKTQKTCRYCDRVTNLANIKKHEKLCHLNPENIKLCPVCETPIKTYKRTSTCSYACSNKLYRSGPNNGNWNEENYQTTCFYHHKKECVVCGESNIVTVHHLDENHNNNSPENLIPLCPTHHQYWHSRYKHMVEQKVLDYIKEWSTMRDLNSRSPGPKPGGLPDFPNGRQ